MNTHSTNKQVLYLSYDGMTDPLGQSQVLPYLSGLAKHGYEFTLISFEKKQRFAQQQALINQICTQNNIHWLPLPYTKKPPVLSTLYDLLKLKSLVKKLHRQKNFQLVHCRSYPTSLIGLYLKRKFNIRFIFDMRGFWANERVDGNLWNLKNPMYNAVYQFFKNKEKQFLETADCTISLTHRAAHEIGTWKHLNQSKLTLKIIPCCVDLQLFNPQNISPNQQTALRQELNLSPSDFVLSYLGSLGTWYLADEMMQFFAELKKQIPNAKFLLITPDQPDNLITLAQKNGVNPQDLCITFKNRNQVPQTLSLSQYAIFFIKPAYSKIASSPTKQAEIMAMGIPAICNANIGDTDAIIQQYNSGISIPQLNTHNYQQAIQTILNNPQTAQNAHAIRAGADQYFSLQTGINLYLSVYQQLIP